ncbi:MAG TPA: hypothetical protein VGB85_14520 [Nannocystis sp.]|jgi:hypothetical protein
MATINRFIQTEVCRDINGNIVSCDSREAVRPQPKIPVTDAPPPQPGEHLPDDVLRAQKAERFDEQIDVRAQLGEDLQAMRHMQGLQKDIGAMPQVNAGRFRSKNRF